MKNEGKFISGEEVKGKPNLFIGCAENPFADPFEIRAMRLAKKAAAGAQFVQTQCVFNVEKFEKWMEMVRDLGVDKKIYILAGITPYKSIGMANYMKKSVPGMDVPDEHIERLRGVPKEKVSEEGVKICLEIIERVKAIKGVAGIHIMAIEWEQIVAEIVTAAKLYPRPQTIDGN